MGNTLTKITGAAKLGTAEKKRLAAKGRKAVATVVAMKRTIKKAFYAMGRALAVLKEPAVFHALGHPSFAQLCTTIEISESQADRLIAITEHFSPRDAKKMITSTKATSIIDLASAIGGKTTAKGLLKQGTVHLSDGQTIDIRSASSHAIDGAARRLRSRRKPSGHGGLMVSPNAKHFFTALRAATKKAKLADVRIEEIAASKSDEAKMRLVASVHDAGKLADALKKAAQMLTRH